jgi:hypothetical protein
VGLLRCDDVEIARAVVRVRAKRPVARERRLDRRGRAFVVAVQEAKDRMQQPLRRIARRADEVAQCMEPVRKQVHDHETARRRPRAPLRTLPTAAWLFPSLPEAVTRRVANR